jgi:hypothetical protein
MTVQGQAVESQSATDTADAPVDDGGSAPKPPSERAEPKVARRPSAAGVILTAACGLGIAFLLLQILTYGYGRDQGIYSMVARAILAGKMPYRDVWDFKPPGIFLIYAVTRQVLGSAQVSIRIVECLGLVAMVFAMMRLTERWWGDRRIGMVSGAIAVLVHAQLDFWHTAQPESFGGLVTLFALLALGPSPWSEESATPDRRALRRWVLSGALFGVAGLLKPPLAGGGAVVAVVLASLAFSSRRGWKAAIRPVIAVAIGGALPIVLCLLWFLVRGALGDLYQVLFVFTPNYTKLSWEGETLHGMAWWGFTEWFIGYSSVTAVGLLLMLALRPSPRERSGALVIGAIIFVHLAGVTMQGKFFPYHYGATWPLTALLAGLGFQRVWERLSRYGAVGALGFIACFGVVALGRTATKDTKLSYLDRCLLRIELFTKSPRDQRAIDALATVADVNAASNRAVAAALKARVPPGRAIYVWGFEPVIYDQADREPATRYIYNVAQRGAWAREEARAALMRDLTQNPPAAIVVERRDVMPVVTGDTIDSADTLPSFPALRDLLAARYERAETIEDLAIYIER